MSFTTQTIKGVSYASFAATAGNYQATYGIDANTAGDQRRGRRARTDDRHHHLDHERGLDLACGLRHHRDGTDVLGIIGRADDEPLRPAHGLTAGTQYFFKVTSADAAGNSTTAPASATAFTTTGTQPGKTVGDTSTADFGAGTPGTGAYVSETTGGELILTPTVGAEFSAARRCPLAGPACRGRREARRRSRKALSRSTEPAPRPTHCSGPEHRWSSSRRSATAGFQHVGFGVTLDAAPWAIFSTRDGGALYARTNTGATSTDTPIAGNWLSAPHRYRIDWTTSSVSFFIDGTLVATHAVTIADTMRPIARTQQSQGRPSRSTGSA